MDYTIIIVLIFLFIGGYFVYTFIQRHLQFEELCSDDHLFEIRDIFEELYEEVWTEFLAKQDQADVSNEFVFDAVTDDTDTQRASNEEKTKYRVTSKKFLITYKLMSVTLQSKDKSKSKEILIDHLSFSSVKEYFFPKNLVYMAMYFSILLDIKPESFEYTVHQANKGTSGFLFSKTERLENFSNYKKDICTIIMEKHHNSESINEENQDQENQDQENVEQENQDQENSKKLHLEKDDNKELETNDSVLQSLTIQELRNKIEKLSPHIQIQKV